MNKGLEVIEARWLFDLPADRIKVVVHPQSVIHSMVEFVDGSFKAQLGVTDMRHPIQYALTWPRRVQGPLPPLNPAEIGPLTFDSPDTDRFPCLGLAYQAVKAGGTATAVLNAANEVAVQEFLDGRAGFMDIPAIISQTLERSSCAAAGSLEELLALDQDVRRTAIAVAGERSRAC
jgi:1-deoxy-D-xylulose-5-phosphate reductoisomerase